MKLDISRKVATSLKQRESSLISIFKSCFYERDATGTQTSQKINSQKNPMSGDYSYSQVAGAWSERKKMFHGGSFLKLADDDV